MSTQTFIGTLVVQTCCICGMAFGVEENYDRARRDDHKQFYCPAGHGQHYAGKSEAEKLQERLDDAARRERSLNARLTHTRDQLQATEYQRRAQKGVNTRLKNRIAAGVCPCCNRTFQDLARHMSGQHPDFANTDATPS
jgi:hypothetical protein